MARLLTIADGIIDVKVTHPWVERGKPKTMSRQPLSLGTRKGYQVSCNLPAQTLVGWLSVVHPYSLTNSYEGYTNLDRAFHRCRECVLFVSKLKNGHCWPIRFWPGDTKYVCLITVQTSLLLQALGQETLRCFSSCCGGIIMCLMTWIAVNKIKKKKVHYNASQKRV